MYTTYFIDRDALEKPAYGTLLEMLNSEFDHSLLANLPYISFAMLKPDAYLRGLIPEILAILRKNGIYPIHASLVQLDEEVIDNLYMFVKQKYFDTWWVMKKTYTLSSCLPILLVGEKGEYEHLSARIRGIVGPTTPLAGEPNQIRYSLNATHRVFNLIHGTDDPGSAIRESLVFFSKDQIRNAFQAARRIALGNPLQETTDINNLIPSQKIDLRFSQIKLGIKGKLFSEVSQILAHYNFRNKNELLKRLEILMDMEKQVIDKNLSLRQERRELSNILRNQGSLLTMISSSVSKLIIDEVREGTTQRSGADKQSSLEKATNLLHVVFLLGDEVQFYHSNFDRIISEMATHGIILELYEESVLHTGWAVAPQEFVDFHTKVLPDME